MKLIDDDEKGKKVFKPFEMTLRFETEGEARLMWHVFNRFDLWNAMNTGGYGSNYISPPDDFTNQSLVDSCSEDIRDFIASNVSVKKE